MGRQAPKGDSIKFSITCVGGGGGGATGMCIVNLSKCKCSCQANCWSNVTHGQQQTQIQASALGK